MGEQSTSQQIDDQAAAWAARRDRDALSATDRAALDAWIAGDPRAAGALLRAEAFMLEIGSAGALGAGFEARDHSPGQAEPSRRRFLVLGGAAAASLAAGGVLTSLMWAGEAHATGVGEIRLVPLADGSTLTLNTDSRAVVRFNSLRREILVTRGEAYFSVARDPERPFVVKIDDRAIRADGGAFTVHRLDASRSEVTVQTGALRLEMNGASQVVGANARVTLEKDGGARVTPVAGHDVDRGLAWREGKLAFEGETLAEAAAQFARYGGPRIVIPDPALASEPITGLFAANDPAGFTRAAALALGASVEPRREALVIVR